MTLWASAVILLLFFLGITPTLAHKKRFDIIFSNVIIALCIVFLLYVFYVKFFLR